MDEYIIENYCTIETSLILMPHNCLILMLPACASEKKKHYFLVLFFLAISIKYFDYNTFLVDEG